MKSLMPILIAFAVFISNPAHSFSFVNGNIYSTSDDAINQYTETGELVGSLSLSQFGTLSQFGYDLRGLVFGLDRNLYVVRSTNNQSYVDVIRGDGALIKSYDFTGSIAGNISYGKIAFDPTGENFFVSAGNGVYKFNTQENNGSLYINQAANDLDVTSSGDLIVASDYSLLTYSSEGILKNSITSLFDPNNITNDLYPFLVDIRGVEYDDVTDKTFVTMLGYSGIVDMSFKLIQLDGLTNIITGLENYWYGDDLFVTDAGKIIVGSRTLSPGIFSTDLQYFGNLQGNPARFVTALPIPEPNTYLMLLAGLGLICFIRVNRRQSYYML